MRRRQIDDHQVEEILEQTHQRERREYKKYAYDLHLPSLLALLPALATSSGWLTIRVAFDGRLDLAAGEECEPRALESRMGGVRDSGCKCWELVCGER